jgi:hypothetical protein
MTKASCLFLLIVILLTTGLCFSQDARGTIVGRVTDAQDAVIPNVSVKLTNVATGITATVSSNEHGNYQAPYLPLGMYRVTAEAKGFKKLVRENVEVRVNDRLEINLVLQVGEVTESVNVSAETPLLETTSASTGQVIDMRRVAELPIAHGEPYALMASATGAAFTGDPALDRPFEPSHIANYAIGGARGLRNELTLDGAPSGASTANPREVSASFVPPIDIVGEMKVQTIALAASVGQTEGGAVNMTLKSGTNQFHGTGYYNKLAPELNANLFFSNRQGLPIAPLEYNRWGTSATGPVMLPRYNGRNRTFYMYGYEGIKEVRTRGGVTSVPTAEQRTGDLSGLLRLGNSYQIYDPFTRRAVAGGRFEESPIPGNLIDKSRISPIATNILKYYALPNVAGTPDGGNNLSQPNQPEQANYYSHSWRLDHNITDRWRTFGRFNWYNRNSTYSDWFGNEATEEWFWFHAVSGGFDHVYTFSPTLVMNLRYGYNRFIRHIARKPSSLGFDLTSLGFPKSWNDAIPADIRRFPNIDINGYYATNGSVLWRPQDTHEYAVAFDKILGSHSIKVGSDFRLYFKNQINPDINSTGRLIFDTTYTRGPLDNAAASGRGQGLAAFLLGVLSNGGGVERRATFAEKNNMWAFHVQDDWKITRKLTLNLGLRYETESPLEDRWNRSVRGFDPTAQLAITAAAQTAYGRNPTPEVPASAFRVLGGLTFAGVNGQPSGVWNRDSNNIMPRIGLAYSLNNKTVIRTGYGIFYTFMGVRRGDVIQSGYSFTTQVNATQDSGLTFLANIANPFPNGIIEPPGASQGVNTFVGTGVSFFEPNIKTPYGQRWHFSIQRELPSRMMFEASYMGDRGVALETTRDLNAIPLQYLSRTPTRDNTTNAYNTANVANPFAGLVPQQPGRNGVNIQRQELWRAFPQFTSVSLNTNQGYSTYHSLAVRIDKRFSRGYTFQAGYTFSKFLEATGYLNGADPMPVYTISDQDYPHRVNLSFIYELPFGKGRAILGTAPRGVNALVAGWQVQGLYVWQSGPALGFGNSIFFGSNINDIVLPTDQRNIDRWFNTQLFENARDYSGSTNRQLVNSVRTMSPRFGGIRGPNPVNWDLSALKNTKITEKLDMQIRGEFLNAMNHPFFAAPNTDPANTAFGTIVNTRGYARRIQLGIKLIY